MLVSIPQNLGVRHSVRISRSGVTIYSLGILPHSFGAEAMRWGEQTMKCYNVWGKNRATNQSWKTCPHSFGTEAMRRAGSTMKCCKKPVDHNSLLILKNHTLADEVGPWPREFPRSWVIRSALTPPKSCTCTWRMRASASFSQWCCARPSAHTELRNHKP